MFQEAAEKYLYYYGNDKAVQNALYVREVCYSHFTVTYNLTTTSFTLQ